MKEAPCSSYMVAAPSQHNMGLIPTLLGNWLSQHRSVPAPSWTCWVPARLLAWRKMCLSSRSLDTNRKQARKNTIDLLAALHLK